MIFNRIFSSKGRWVTLLVVLLGVMIFATAANAGTVAMVYVGGLDSPDTRGGMVMDDNYVWISAHKDGLWRADRCTGSNAGDKTSDDGAAWDLWWYNDDNNIPKHDGYPADPDGAGYYIYEAGKDGNVYIIDTSAPDSIVGSEPAGSVAYGIYATDPNTAKLYVATDGNGLRVFDITTPNSPTALTTILPSLNFTSVRGQYGHGYVYAASFTDNRLYIVDTTTDTVVNTGGLDFGMSGMIRNPWVYQDENNNWFVYVVNDKGDLWIVDVNTPASPSILTFWDSPAGGDANMPGGASYVRRDYAWVLTSNGNDSGYLYMLDVRDPSNPVLVDTIYDSDFGFNDIRVDDCEIHIAAHDGWKMYTQEGWQGDAWISNTDTSNYIGQNVYEAPPPATQIKTQTLSPTETATFKIHVENDADRRDKFYIKQDPSTLPVPAGWTVQFLDGSGGDITAAVQAGTYLYPGNGYVDPGQSFDMTLTISPDLTATQTTYDVIVLADSWMCPTADCSGTPDAVKAVVEVGRPIMTVEKDDGKTTVTAGDNLPYVITYDNTGNADAYDVVISDVLPVGTTFVSASPAPDTQSGQTLTWNIGGPIAPNSGPYTINLNATVNLDVAAGTDLEDVVTLDYKDVVDIVYTPVTDNDIDTVVGSPITKAVDKDKAQADDILTYTIRVQYEGSDLLSNVTVTDDVPAGTAYVAASANAGGSEAGGTVTWNLGSNTPGTSGGGGCSTTVDLTSSQDSYIDEKNPNKN